MRIIITGGGTAGHVNPGIAIAKYYLNKHPDTEILFVGTENGIEKKLAEKEGISFESIKVYGLKRSVSPKNIIKNTKRAFTALNSVGDCKKIIKRFKPDIIIGLGGYVSFPMTYAGTKMGVKTIVLEVNFVAGVATKVLSKRSDKVLLAFKETEKYFDKRVLDKVLVTGAPTKDDFTYIDKDVAKEKLGLLGKKVVLSVWGSVGAKFMNEKMVDFCNRLDDEFHHIHATGKASFPWFSSQTVNSKSDIREYIYDMGITLAAADVVLCRAGASTLKELAIMKKPAIIVPSPFVAENHQEKNARLLEKENACIIITENESTGDILFDECIKLLNDTKKLDEMSKNIENFANVDSNLLIYNIINELVY